MSRQSKAFDRSVSDAPNAPPFQHFSSISQLDLLSSTVRCSLYETRIDIWTIKNRRRAEFDHKYIFHKFWKYWIICLLADSYLWRFSTSFYPAGKYWSPGRPRKILIDRHGDALIWRPEMKSRGCPNLTFKGLPWEVDSGRPLEDLQSTQTWMSQIFLNFSCRTYSIDQIYLKAFKHSRCIENPVKLLRLLLQN